MNTSEIVLYVFVGVIFPVCIYVLLFTGPMGFNVDIQRKRQERQKCKEQKEEQKNKEIDQTNTKQKPDVKEHELPNIWIDN